MTRVPAGLFIVLVTLTVVQAVVPGVPLAFESLAFDVIVNAAALLAGSLVAGIAFLRLRGGDPVSGAICAAFLVNAALNLLTLSLEASGAAGSAGMALHAPTQEPLYLHGAARATSALLFLAGGLAAGGRVGLPLDRRWVALPVAILVPVALLIHVGWTGLPDWLSPDGLRQLADGQLSRPLGGVSLFAVAFQAAVVAMLAASSLLYARWRPFSGSSFNRYLAVALVIAAVGELQFAIFPGSFSGLVSTNDLFRLASALVLLIGIGDDLRASDAALAVATRQLREAEQARIALDERSRLAREIHDGLSQHLWIAKLKVEQLTVASAPASPALVAELADLVELGLAEARQTVDALRTIDGEQPLADLLRRSIEAFANQRGIPVDFVMETDLGMVNPHASAEVVRIIQEALNNVARHADATRVRVVVNSDRDRLAVSIRDNGIGFEPGLPIGGFGLTSMRERAEGIGGQLAVESAPSAGTTVNLTVPSQ
jgi:signal transduction histidine kinase